MRWPAGVVALAVLSGAVGTALPARGKGAREACLESFEKAQRARKDGRFKNARDDFRSCAAESCPGLVRKDCTDGLAELGKQIPTARVSARDETGEESEFSLEIDGQPIDETDQAIELDPGEHVFKFVFGNGKSSEKRVTFKPGELNVPVVGELQSPPKSATNGSESKPPVSPRATPPIVYVLGGVAIVGLGTFIGFGLAGKKTAECEGSCSDAEVQKVGRQYLIADIGLVVALASGGAAAYFYFTRPATESARSKGPRPSFVALVPLRRGAALATGLSF